MFIQVSDVSTFSASGAFDAKCVCQKDVGLHQECWRLMWTVLRYYVVAESISASLGIDLRIPRE